MPALATAGATVAVVALAAVLVAGAVVADASGVGASFEAHALEARAAASTPATIPGRNRATVELNLVTAQASTPILRIGQEPCHAANTLAPRIAGLCPPAQ